MDINDYNLGALDNGTTSQADLDNLIKAMTAGDQTGQELINTETSGASLKTESLEPMLKILTSKEKNIVLYNMIPKQKAYNTVEEYNQLIDYGGDSGIFNLEGETPSFTDSIYERKSVLVKYTGIAGEVTHQASLVRLGNGVKAMEQEVYNKTQYLLRAINKNLTTANSGNIGTEFDGIFKQHFDGLSGGGSLDTYANSTSVIDARGNALSDEDVENAVQSVVNDNFGNVSSIIGNPKVFSNYVKRFHEIKRVNVNDPSTATTGAIMGQKVNQIQTQFGNIDIKNDIFFDYKVVKAYNTAATNAKSPAAPTVDGTTPIAVNADTSTKFDDGAGTYWYGVTAKNRYGESAMSLFATAGQAVAATESVDLKFAQTDTAYASESFVIYRTKSTATAYTTAEFHQIFEINKTQLATGFDGAAAGLVRDRNRSLPGTTSAIVLDNSTDVWAIKQLAPIMKMALARTSPSERFMILSYLTPVIYQPKKVARIINLGDTIS